MKTKILFSENELPVLKSYHNFISNLIFRDKELGINKSIELFKDTNLDGIVMYNFIDSELAIFKLLTKKGWSMNALNMARLNIESAVAKYILNPDEGYGKNLIKQIDNIYMHLTYPHRELKLD